MNAAKRDTLPKIVVIAKVGHADTVANEIADPRIPGAAVRARVIAVIAAAHHAHVHGIVVIGEAAASGNEAVVDGVGVAVAVAIDDELGLAVVIAKGRPSKQKTPMPRPVLLVAQTVVTHGARARDLGRANDSVVANESTFHAHACVPLQVWCMRWLPIALWAARIGALRYHAIDVKTATSFSGRCLGILTLRLPLHF